MPSTNIYENYSKQEMLDAASLMPLDHLFTKKMARLINAYKNNYVHYQSIYSAQNALKLFNKAVLMNSNIIKKLGNGGFSFVYEGIDNLVYKLSLSNEHEDAWLFYARSSKKINNTLFPIIHQLNVYNHDYCCKMEKLTKLDLRSADKQTLKAISISILKKDIDSSFHLINTVGLVDYDSYSLWSAKLYTIMKRHTHLHFDFHQDNLMLRGQHLVITDPLS